MDIPHVDLLTQVINQMTPETRESHSVHVARNEIFASPTILAYASLAQECQRWLDGDEIDMTDDRYAGVYVMNGLGVYEKGGHASREDDAIILDNVLEVIREDAEATDRQDLHDLVATRP